MSAPAPTDRPDDARPGAVDADALAVATPADVLTLTRIVQGPDGATLLPRLGLLRESTTDPEIAAAVSYVETISVVHSNRGSAILAAGRGRRLGMELERVDIVAVFDALLLHIEGFHPLDELDRIAGISISLESFSSPSIWAPRAWNTIGLVLFEAGLFELASEMYTRVVLADDSPTTWQIRESARLNRAGVVFDRMLWSILLGEDPAQETAIIDDDLAGRLPSPPPPARYLLQLDCVRVLAGDDEAAHRLDTELDGLDDRPELDDTPDLVRIALIDHSLRVGDLDRARRLIDQLELIEGYYVSRRPHLLPWLRSRLLTSGDDALADHVTQVTRVAWGEVLRQRSAVENAVRARIGSERELRRSARLRREARQDSLTGIGNRRRFDELLAAETGGATLLIVDLDEFKVVNDTHGHLVGDAVLRAVAEQLRLAARADDVVCRPGGDEFVVIVRSTRPEVSARRPVEILAAVAEHDWGSIAPELDVTVSIGVAVGAGDVARIYGRADRALYAVKRRGGDGWALAEGDDTITVV